MWDLVPRCSEPQMDVSLPPAEPASLPKRVQWESGVKDTTMTPTPKIWPQSWPTVLAHYPGLISHGSPPFLKAMSRGGQELQVATNQNSNKIYWPCLPGCPTSRLASGQQWETHCVCHTLSSQGREQGGDWCLSHPPHTGSLADAAHTLSGSYHPLSAGEETER